MRSLEFAAACAGIGILALGMAQFFYALLDVADFIIG